MHRPFVLVTGATGFLGTALVHHLVERGEHVIAFVRAGSNLSAFAGLPSNRFELAFGDILIDHTVYRAMRRCSRVYHLASVMKLWAKNPKEISDPAEQGTESVLRAAEALDIERVVVTSSVSVLGRTLEPTPMDETHEFNLEHTDAYANAKRAADQVVSKYLNKGLPIVRVLPSTMVGPGDNKPTPVGHMLLEYLRTATRMAFPVFEGGIALADVADVAKGHVLAMERGKVGERYILSGENLTYAQAFGLLSDVTGLPAPSKPHSAGLALTAATVMELGARLFGGEPLVTRSMAQNYVGKYVWVSSAKAQAELGFQPSPIRGALSRAVRWFLAHGYVPPQATERVRLELRPV